VRRFELGGHAGQESFQDQLLLNSDDAVVGVEKQLILQRFLTSMPTKFEPATGDVRLCAVVVDCDESTGRARSIERLVVRGD